MLISARAFKRIFTCKCWLRYSRERALESLPNRAVQPGPKGSCLSPYASDALELVVVDFAAAVLVELVELPLYAVDLHDVDLVCLPGRWESRREKDPDRGTFLKDT